MYQTRPFSNRMHGDEMSESTVKGGVAMTKRTYERPVLKRLGLLRELTKFSGQPGHHRWW
jgi:hypothetical protein